MAYSRITEKSLKELFQLVNCCLIGGFILGCFIAGGVTASVLNTYHQQNCGTIIEAAKVTFNQELSSMFPLLVFFVVFLIYVWGVNTKVYPEIKKRINKV